MVSKKRSEISATTYILRHGMHIRVWSIVHHCICKHQIDIALELEGVGDDAVFYPCLDCFEIHWSLDNFMIVWCFRILDWIVEYISIAVLGDLRMEHANDILEALGSNLLFRPCGVSCHARSCVVRGWTFNSLTKTHDYWAGHHTFLLFRIFSHSLLLRR